MDFTPAQVVAVATGISGVVIVALRIAWETVKAKRVKNGHAPAGRASVQPKDAMWFAQTQAKTLRVLNRIAKRLGVEGEQESDFE